MEETALYLPDLSMTVRVDMSHLIKDTGLYAGIQIFLMAIT